MLLAPGGFDPADFTHRPPCRRTVDHVGRHALRASDGAGGRGRRATGPVAITDSVEAKIRNVMGAVPQLIGDGRNHHGLAGVRRVAR